MPGIRTSVSTGFSACRTCVRKVNRIFIHSVEPDFRLFQCWKWFHCHRPVQGLVLVLQEEYAILCLGLSRTGKTTLLHHLVGESAAGATDPTTGFNIRTFPLSNLYPENGVLSGKSISVKEIGGSKAVRPFWNHYFHNKHAVMFVVNCAASDQDLQSSKSALIDVLSDERLKDKPFLIVGTHADVAGARTSEQLQHFFSDVMRNQCCSARSCCAFNEEQVKSALSVLIDLMLQRN